MIIEVHTKNRYVKLECPQKNLARPVWWFKMSWGTGWGVFIRGLKITYRGPDDRYR